MIKWDAILRKFHERHFEESLLFVTIGIITALICSFYALIFSATEHLSLHFFELHAWLPFVTSPLCLVIAFLLVRWFAPGSSGSGIPQVMACIEDTHKPLRQRFLRKLVIVIKVFSSLIGVFGGAAIGREGPSLQISASIAYQISQFFERFKVRVKLEQILVAGAASGLAAAFNTPIGGIVYAIEELSKEHVRNFKDVLLLSVVISGLTAQLISGNYLYLGNPTVSGEMNAATLVVVVLVSLVTGMAGALFSKLLSAFIDWRSSKSFTIQLSMVLGCGLILAFLLTSFGGLSLYSGKEAINSILFDRADVSVGVTLSRFFAPLISSATGIAGGIFAPSLSAGAALGGFISQYWDPSYKVLLGLTGMVGFLTGVTLTPITSFVLVLEMTDRHAVVFPMMLAAVFSSIGAHFLAKHSFYEITLHKILEKEKAEEERLKEERSAANSTPVV
jgi:H+/Cl- antiporter ClcA